MTFLPCSAAAHAVVDAKHFRAPYLELSLR